MAMFIMINGSTPGMMLDDSVDVEQLRETIHKAMLNSSVVELSVMLGDHGGEPATLLLNGQSLASVAFAEF